MRFFDLKAKHSRPFAIAGAFLIGALPLLTGGCSSSGRPAPVVERNTIPPVAKQASVKAVKTPDARPQIHNVQKGDTLYGISLEYGLDYKEIAEWNAIVPPYTIRVGQQLRMRPAAPPEQSAQVVVTPLKSPAMAESALPAGEASQSSGDAALLKTEPKALKLPYSEQALAVVKPTPVPMVPLAPPAAGQAANAVSSTAAVSAVKAPEEKKEAATDDDDKLEWAWPAQGKVVGEFNESASLKGVDIAGKSGQAVNAAAAGKVVYSGSGLRGYGKLVIVKHNKTYLSAYAHNSQILVKEGQSVTRGQKIAEMGDSDADRVKLHFEIRRFGKPVDPLKYLSDSAS
jgi:lipoprotein NlpD